MNEFDKFIVKITQDRLDIYEQKKFLRKYFGKTKNNFHRNGFVNEQDKKILSKALAKVKRSIEELFYARANCTCVNRS